jgi:hypothetical protein
MNERIEDIARQCMSMRFFVDTASEDFDYKKFAELIVQECVNVGSLSWLSDNSKVPTFPAKQIKEHFGVK